MRRRGLSCRDGIEERDVQTIDRQCSSCKLWRFETVCEYESSGLQVVVIIKERSHLAVTANRSLHALFRPGPASRQPPSTTFPP